MLRVLIFIASMSLIGFGLAALGVLLTAFLLTRLWRRDHQPPSPQGETPAAGSNCQHHPDASWLPQDLVRPATPRELKNPVFAAYVTFWPNGRLRAVHTVAKNGRVLSDGLEISQDYDAGTYQDGVRSWESFNRTSRSIQIDWGDESESRQEPIDFEAYVRGRIVSLVQGYDKVLLVPEGRRLWQGQFWEQPD